MKFTDGLGLVLPIPSALAMAVAPNPCAFASRTVAASIEA
jgi:hypothetical protein